ncbi:MAG: bacillithiol biosynthesis protein BshC, partial [Bacteroidota bacterium]
MKRISIPRQQTGLFSDLANKLVYEQSELKDYIQKEFSLEAFAEQIELKKSNYSTENRKILSSVLNENYASIEISESQKENLEQISENNTFTVTTGHQLSLLTGPLYFVIKILHAAKLAEELKNKYSHSNFVPVFWMAS